MRELETYELARILVRAAIGEDWGDGYTVTDIVTGYAEPGYGSDDAVIIFGNWNDKRYPRGDEAPLSKSERIGSRLFDALESIGAHCEWLDEWTSCGECYRAMRTQADSYSWKMYGAFIEDACEYVCADCILKDLGAYLSEYVNNSARCLTFGTGSDLSALGFTQWAPNDPQRYESGWHPGQDADPSSILSEIEDEYEGREVEVVFVLDESSQFYIGFSAWFRVEEIEDDSDEDEDSEDAEEPNSYAVSGGLIDELRQSERMLGEW